MRASTEDGLARMRALALRFPSQLVDGFRAGRESSGSRLTLGNPVFAAGMGGSAIAADLARSLLIAETELVLVLTRGPTLPRAVGHGSSVILLSYTGDTWETLAAYDEAGRRGARRIAVSSGGTLGERAQRDFVPHLQIPPGMPPRAAAGFMLGLLLGFLDPAFPESLESRVLGASARLEERIHTFERSMSGPARLAKAVGSRVPFVYADSEFVPLARRWKTQVEENAKRLAVFDEFPEVLHNAIVGWDAIPRHRSREFAVLLLEWSAHTPTASRRLKYFEALLRDRGVKALRVPLAFDDRLEAMIEGLSLADFFSLFLAENARVDPYPIDAITRLKDASRTTNRSKVDSS